MQHKYTTAEERKQLYTELVKDIDRGDRFGMCLRAGKYMDVDLSLVLSILPELNKQAPEKHWCRGLWYFIDPIGMQHRKRALLKAIELCNTP